MAEVSRFKDCDAIGSKDKVCLQELQQTSMLLPRLLTSCCKFFQPLLNSSTDFSPLVNSSQRPSTLRSDLHLCAHLLDSPQVSFHLSLLFPTPSNSCCLTSPQLHVSNFPSPVEVTQVQTFLFLQQRSHLQAKKLGEDGVGECHLI